MLGPSRTPAMELTDTYFDRNHLARHYATVEDFASRSRAWETLAKTSISQWYVDTLAKYSFTEVLDAGCGHGRFSVALAQARPVNITALDIAEEMVEATRRALGDKAGNHGFIQSSIDEAPFERGQFDLVLANLVLHHAPDIRSSFARIAELTKSGGHVALLTADFDWMSELNRFQDEALLRLGFAHDHPALAAPGTNRFCAANIRLFSPDSLTLVEKPWFDGTMTFPTIDALLDFYVRTFRHKNVASQAGGDVLRRAVREIVEEHVERTGSLDVSSSVYLYIFQKR
ncbi:class I SAM-dependent methyltransferase [Methylosinus sporium]|uniref:Class I SAM-dependent methyltransferase n=2 Tax=Methylocystaceae TaxID=31993 RepID=A0A549SXH8_METSR|nr:class I SAM-dependent methyltransferase [Methylosinus sporium]